MTTKTATSSEDKPKPVPGADFGETKTFGLRPAETQFLRYMRMHQEAIFAGFLSTVATDRLAYHVTPNTKFELNEDFSEIKMTEMPPAPEEAPEAPKEDNSSPVVTAPETK